MINEEIRTTVPLREASRTSRWVIVAAAAVTGIVLAVIWSHELVDQTVGDNVANTMLGYDARQTAVTGATTGLIFAFVTGLAGTFTACNIAVFGALPKIAAAQDSGSGPMVSVLHSLGWLTAGMVAVSATYGVVGVVVSDYLPQLSAATVGEVPARLVQASVVFGLIGIGFGYLGLAALGLAPDPFAHRPAVRLAVLGGLVGAFLVGRPFPLFRQLFEHAVESGSPLYGALAFTLQSVGNVLLVVLLAALVVVSTRGAVTRWLVARPERASGIAGFALLTLGVFMVAYWDLRIPAHFGYGWFPGVA